MTRALAVRSRCAPMRTLRRQHAQHRALTLPSSPPPQRTPVCVYGPTQTPTSQSVPPSPDSSPTSPPTLSHHRPLTTTRHLHESALGDVLSGLHTLHRVPLVSVHLHVPSRRALPPHFQHACGGGIRPLHSVSEENLWVRSRGAIPSRDRRWSRRA
jgi:hypothetical protein